LPLQMSARKKGNTLFVDEKLEPFEDQWQYLFDVQKLSEEDLASFTTKLSKGNELGVLKEEDANVKKPWLKEIVKIHPQDFLGPVEIVKSEMLYVKKSGLSHKALNILKRFAAFKNPDFYKTQAMRLPTYKKPRVISCSEDFEDYLALPRGCEDDIKNLLSIHMR